MRFFGIGNLEFWASYGSVWTIYQGDQEVLGIPLNQVSGEKCLLTGKKPSVFHGKWEKPVFHLAPYMVGNGGVGGGNG